jgi:hypothetical protein
METANISLRRPSPWPDKLRKKPSVKCVVMSGSVQARVEDATESIANAELLFNIKHLGDFLQIILKK